MAQQKIEKLNTALRKDWFADHPLGEKARRYVGQFFDRKLAGKKLSAKVEGNHGTYKLSITTKAGGFDSVFSCYIGGCCCCRQCDAPAQTFFDAAESFTIIKQKRRQSTRTP